MGQCESSRPRELLAPAQTVLGNGVTAPAKQFLCPSPSIRSCLESEVQSLAIIQMTQGKESTVPTNRSTAELLPTVLWELNEADLQKNANKTHKVNVRCFWQLWVVALPDAMWFWVLKALPALWGYHRTARFWWAFAQRWHVRFTGDAPQCSLQSFIERADSSRILKGSDFPAYLEQPCNTPSLLQFQERCEQITFHEIPEVPGSKQEGL